MGSQSKPKISAFLSLSPTTHSYANPQAPNLNLTLTSHHPNPITLYTDDLSPTLMLKCGAFTTTSLTNGCDIKQSISTHCRIPPPSKVSISLNEQLFHTLLPNTPLTLSAPFTRSRKSTGGKPLAKDDPNFANDGFAKHGACGVDGLEPGQDYVLRLAGKPRVSWDVVRWWDYGTKEQVLRAGGEGSGLDGRKVKFGRGPHEAIRVDCSGIGGVLFRCLE